MTVVGARLAGRFDVRSRGREAPGYVEMRASDAAAGGAEVALWWIQPGLHALIARDTFLAEGERLRAVVAPGLRRLTAIGEAPEALWAAYAVAEPGPQPRAGGAMPIEQVAAWVRAVATGLDAAHQHGFCHGRLIPADVGLIGGGLVVGGVGLWHDVEPARAARAWRSMEAFVAPEVRGGAPPTPAADAWSLAVCAAAFALGAPDGGRDLERAVTERYPALARALAGGLAREPERRVAVRDLALRIADAAGKPAMRTPIGAVPAPASPASEKKAKKPGLETTGPLRAVSMRPEGGRAASEPAEDLEESSERKARIRPIAEVSGRSFATQPGALGYMAPPRSSEEERANRRRRTILLAAAGGASVLAVVVAIAVIVGGGGSEGDPKAGGDRARGAGPALDAGGPRDAAAATVAEAVIDAALARACTTDMPAIGAGCIDAYEAPGEGRLPETGVTLDDARAACGARGLRLCRAEEWRAACAGDAGSAWPYGSIVERGACNVGSRSLIAKAGAFPRCRSAAGVFDLAGNVAEWLADGTIIGGSAIDGSDGRCDTPVRRTPRGGRFADVGYRCCGDR